MGFHASVLTRLDQLQQRHGLWAFPFAVLKKFGDDRCGQLAAVTAYYAFFSIFPLLVVMVTLLGFILSGHPGLRRDMLDTALTQFPTVGKDLQGEIQGLEGNVITLLVGMLGLLWSGLAAVQSIQDALNTIWNVPIKARPSFLSVRLRSLLALGMLGAGLTASTALANIGPTVGRLLGAFVAVLGSAGSFALSTTTLVGIFVVLTERDLAWRTVLPGALFGALGWTIIHALGGLYVGRIVSSSSATYGSFAIVIGLLSWLYLQMQVLLLAAEVNVVRDARLWPRGLRVQDLTEADRSALVRTAHVEERIPDEHITVHLPPRGPADPSAK